MTDPTLREKLIEGLVLSIADQADVAPRDGERMWIAGGCTPRSAGVTLDLGFIADSLLALLPTIIPPGFWLAPDEPSARHLADAMMIVVAEKPTARDFAICGAVLELLPPTGHPDARVVIAEFARDYRAMRSASPMVRKAR